MAPITVLLASLVVSSGSPEVLSAGQEAANLAAELSRTVTVSKELSGRLVFVERHDCSALTAIKGLADCLHASLVNTAQGSVIQRTKEDERQIRAALVATRSDWLRRSLFEIDKYRKAHLDPSAPVNSVAGEVDRQDAISHELEQERVPKTAEFTVRELMPAEGLLVGLLGRIGVAKLAESSLQERTVFEDRPITGAEALPEHVGLSDEYSSEIEAFNVANLPTSAIRRDGFWKNEMDRFAAGWGSKPKVVSRLRLEEVCVGNQIDLLLQGYDASGSEVLRAEVLSGPTKMLSTPDMLIKQAANDKTDQVWCQLPGEGAAAAKWVSDPGKQKFPEWFVHPDKMEPMNLFVAPALKALAEADSTKCVAIEVTDSFWPLTQQCVRNGAVSMKALKETISQWTPFERVEKGDEVLWRPEDPRLAESRQADRKELARFAQQAQQEGHASLRATARLYHDGSVEAGGLTNIWEFDARVALNQWSTEGKNLTSRMYKLIGDIADSEWRSLTSGQTLTSGELGTTADLTRLVEDDDSISAEADGPIPDIYKHYRELFPNGVSDQTPISVRALQVPVMQSWPIDPSFDMWGPMVSSSGEPMIHGFLGIRLVNGTFAPRQSRDEFEAGFQNRMFRLGQTDGQCISIGLPLGIWVRAESHGFVTSHTDPMRYSDLPQSYRDFCWQTAYSATEAKAAEMQQEKNRSSIALPQQKPPPR